MWERFWGSKGWLVGKWAPRGSPDYCCLPPVHILPNAHCIARQLGEGARSNWNRKLGSALAPSVITDTFESAAGFIFQRSNMRNDRNNVEGWRFGRSSSLNPHLCHISLLFGFWLRWSPHKSKWQYIDHLDGQLANITLKIQVSKEKSDQSINCVQCHNISHIWCGHKAVTVRAEW